jgi:NADPH:quinone reductase-like Zn-dependent oxidoreductase
MKAVILPAYNKNVLRAMLSLNTEEAPIPSVGKDQLLVKMEGAICNPSDIAFIRGEYNIVKALPATPGFEGAGVVTEAAQDLSHLVGKRVSCFVQSENSGTWAEYFVVNEGDFVVLDDGFDAEQAAAFSVNPFTAYGLVEIAKLRESRAVLQNAGGGQVAAMINMLASLEGMEVINIVRKPETAEQLQTNGLKNVLSEQDENFENKLTEMAHELKATTAFDAVGGPLSGIMFNAMPPDAELVSYGGLSGKRIIDINEMHLIFRNKIISGFNLIDWKNELGSEDFEEVNSFLQKLFLQGRMRTNFQHKVRLDDIIGGLRTYIGNMSVGKLLIKP